MLLASSLIAAGAVAPVVLDSGRSKARKHYYYALRKADVGLLLPLAAMVAYSVVTLQRQAKQTLLYTDMASEPGSVAACATE